MNRTRIQKKKYQVIYADPPWTYKDKASAGKRGASSKYKVMTVDELCQMLPYIDSIAAPDCLLAMWWVGPLPEEALKVVAAWGFKLKTMLGFSWVKLTKKNSKIFFGMGNWTRANSEHCLFAVRGKPKVINRSVSQVIFAKIREHSRKPDETRDRLVQLMGNVPRIELFARQRHKGWDAMGNQLPVTRIRVNKRRW